MPALCTSPTAPGCDPLSASAPGHPAPSTQAHPIGHAFAQLVTTLQALLPHTRSDALASAANDLGLRVGASPSTRVRAAERYMAARLAGRNDDVLRLVSDDVELTSSRDGVVAGKPRFRDYIGRVKPTGTWRAATWNAAIGKAEVVGNVRILMVNVPVIAHFGFDRKGKISRIYVGTRRKAPK